MTNEEIQQKADELSKQYNCKVHPLVFKAEDETEEIIGYLKEPQRQVKTSLMDRAMTQPVTACAEILEAYIIKEHSDSRIYDGVSENDKYYHGAVLEIYNMVKVSTNQFKKK